MIFKNLNEKQLGKLASELAKQVVKTARLPRLDRKHKARHGGQGAIIGLRGNLGAGKTTFAKAFAKQLKIHSLKSPTFIVNQQYKLPGRSLYHLDFYRLNRIKQLDPLGLEELLIRPNIVLIEWVDKFPKIVESCDILISFKVKPKDKRDIEVKFKK
ncbi:MAG: tRNA (adenosine(37)-N6)-threonylcarbamoyltransferase complex ATPase subunit type 1 TsaE [Candidatus Doudnabacteria bacterium RIFCSPLOWO2_02_FULL_42_9]|uniref:tRNA threonylcarbamoyladenosine biosynthesis protein TsaE n=1 Tax=Candidatus Doudnabacteria bacterium RIFCSPHIGHO2_01_FULL_41_86 TaxID=1817821 RepID=A0A1F5N7F5_9BACT|nr:MAG: tRNA (adenosine(37)-N6)-threonylcarbamoyltransferase complex ATPase subunit type 1 TsaE [Candidatus Doudnabacteria bacterium RIFCSPHIGHO2_01_FULL_41_86]OGE74687.1 MAG: tRNA (adenosine(37)-N6)-threonylcarbamoyltransferase complex ATPase subunit type 1 TsaE [Candidatus Doudnabacteria bacterium RIFCSPHIGHO2_01_43_10]OGE85046.1 MAG: tRNA (adenosine(37)-N6)-threonylcarbamoyltransferase complex ATPase subunit type 1 TsaE [Candidatus Doudnabacteria bacterium RIFCSPHIGHO2_12_FULL_42_22]OGE86487.